MQDKIAWILVSCLFGFMGFAALGLLFTAVYEAIHAFARMAALRHYKKEAVREASYWARQPLQGREAE